MLFSKNAEAQAAQSRIDSLKAEFERKTATLLSEQKAKLRLQMAVLDDEIGQRNGIIITLKESIQDAELELSTVKADILLGKDDLKSILKEVEIAQDNLVATRSQQKQADDRVVSTKAVVTDAELAISRLSAEESRLLESISSREGQLASLEQQIVNATTAFDTEKTNREENLRQLDAKLLVVTTEIEQKLADEQLTRKSLAEWQSRLEAQDQNLRIREMNVAEGETKMIQNSNLLNL